MSDDLKEIQLSQLEEKAMRDVDSAFERNKIHWKPDHDRQHRLFNMILSAPNPDKPDIEGRSNIKTGITWMIHQIIFSILKNSLLTLAKNIRLDPTGQRRVILWLEQMQEYLDRLISDEEWPVYQNLRSSLFDMISHGTAVMRPYYREDLKIVWDGENEIETLNYSGPDLPYIASWDVYPTAGATSVEECHEIIFYEWYYPHELRALERAGLLKNVEEVLRDYKEPDDFAKSKSEIKEPREQHTDLRTDQSGRIGVLVYWGLFPLYEGDEYLDDDGKDRSKDEVECLIIKPVDKKIPMFMDRNKYYHQKKESIFAKYFNIPGMFWGESIFGIGERLFVHQEDWFNIIQDSANMEVYRDRVFSSAIDATQRQQKGVGRDYVVDKEIYKEMNGKVMDYLDRGSAILPDTYDQRNYVDRIIQEFSGIMDFLRAAGSDVPKTATEVQQLAASLNIRFEQTAMEVGGQLLVQSVAWMCSILASDEANDEFLAEQMGTVINGMPINPFKQFSPMMPNSAYRIKLEGSLRAVQNIGMQQELKDLIEQAKTMPPGFDENGELVQADPMRMFLEELKLSKLSDTDEFKRPWTPPVAPVGPDGQPVVAGMENANVPGA